MQVILFENIDKLGMQGEVVNVADGFYRNFLGPQAKAVEATGHNLRRLEAKRKKLQVEAERQLGDARTVAARLEEVSLTYVRRAADNGKLYGSVQAHEIIESLTELGFAIERRQIVLKDALKTTGDHPVRIRVIGNVEATVKVLVEAEAEEVPVEEVPAEEAPAEEAAEAPAEEAAEAEAPAEEEAKSE